MENPRNLQNTRYCVFHDGEEHELVLYDALGEGGQGMVYAASWDGTSVACKVCPVDHKRGTCAVQGEYYTLRGLRESVAVPNPIAMVSFPDMQMLVMERLDRSLADIMYETKRCLSEPIALKICADVLKQLKTLHEKNLLFLDLKSNNIMVGFGEKAHTLYLVDMGCVSKLNTVHKNEGTPLFSSIACMEGKPIRACDELESLYYLISHLMYGLPWTKHVYGRTKYTPKIFKDILAAKLLTTPESLFKTSPKMQEFVREINNVKSGTSLLNYTKLLDLLQTDATFHWQPRSIPISIPGSSVSIMQASFDRYCVTIAPETEPIPPPQIEQLAIEVQTSGKTLEAVLLEKTRKRPPA